MRTALLLLLALAALGLSSTPSAADVWKWVDAKGVTHYSDQPVPGATKVEVRAGNISESRSAEPASEPEQPAQTAAASYTTLEITQPQNGQSIVNTSGQVNVAISIQPAVNEVHRVSLYLDGRLVSGFPRNTLMYTLNEVPRGSHNVSAAVTDHTGKTLKESPLVEFTVRQESIAKPPVGPSLKPPPKPRPGANKPLTQQPSYGTLNGAPPTMNPATNLPVVKKKPEPKKP